LEGYGLLDRTSLLLGKCDLKIVDEAVKLICKVVQKPLVKDDVDVKIVCIGNVGGHVLHP